MAFESSRLEVGLKRRTKTAVVLRSAYRRARAATSWERYAYEVSSGVLKSGARGGGITTLGQLVRIALQFGSLVVLSRLLDPASFGLVAMVTVFVSLGELLRDFGLANAALQAKTLESSQQTNLFWMNTGLGAGFGLLMIAIAPLLAHVYGEPEVRAIALSLASVMVLNGMQAQIQVHLARRMQFLALTVTDLVAQAASIVIAIVIASTGGGYWALVWQTISNAVLILVLRAFAGRWSPGLPKRDGITRPLIKDAAHLGSAQLLNFAASNADTVVIGAIYGAGPLGFYNRAFQLLTAPVSKILAPLTRVSVPSIMSAQREGHDHHALLLRVQSVLGVPLVLVFAVVSSTAPVLIPLLLGDSWGESVVLFQLLSIGGCFQVLSYATYWGFLLSRQSRAYLQYTLLVKPVAVLLVIIGGTLGLEWIAVGFSIGVTLSWPIGLVWLKRCAGQPLLPFLRGGMRIMLAGVVAFLCGHMLLQLALPVWAQLVVSGCSTVIVFVAILALTQGGRQELRLLVRTAGMMIRR